MIKVQTATPFGEQIFEIKRDFYYVRDLVEKCAQYLKKKNVRLYFDKDCQKEIGSDLKIEQAEINQTIYAKIIENEFEQSSQYGDVICWFIRDGQELEQGVQLRSDFTFEEVLDDAIYQNIITSMPKQIKVTNYRKTQVLATLMEMQMFKLIDQNEKEPQLTIHFTTNEKEPIVENTQFNQQFPQRFPVFQGPRKEFQPNMAQRNQNFQQQFPNQQQQPFQQFQQLNTTNFQPSTLNTTAMQNKPQIYNTSFQPQPNFPLQKPQNFNNNIQQSQQIPQSNIIGQSAIISQVQNNKTFQINQQNSNIKIQQGPQVGFPPTFNLNAIPSDKSPNQSLQKNQNNPFVPLPKNPIIGLPNQNTQQQFQFQNSQQQQLEFEAIRKLEQLALNAQKTLDSNLLLGNFHFTIDQQGGYVSFSHLNLKITGFFIEPKGKEISLKNENNLKWQTKFGVSIALSDNLGFVIKWKNNTYNSILMNFL
ncbi:unnamed protein product [Paramecium octaurelia]|uniref:Uncharacterized protein n=1 Tax=Paramecium octaurelia TaxID=43137 RepID=A0A8S1XYT5_PAROT|nr:unnamed protein product [Paramecium octaurelia]